MAWQVEFTRQALNSLKGLDRSVAARVLRRIHWLADNFDFLTPEALSGELSGLFKLRIGNYRALYSFQLRSQTITIHLVGHRREIYQE